MVKLFIAQGAHGRSGHLGRDATYTRACDWGTESITQVIHQCEMCCHQASQMSEISLEKRVAGFPTWWGLANWLPWTTAMNMARYMPRWESHILTMVEATIGWLETYPVSCATAQNTILGLKIHIFWQKGTPRRIESDNGTHSSS